MILGYLLWSAFFLFVFAAIYTTVCQSRNRVCRWGSMLTSGLLLLVLVLELVKLKVYLPWILAVVAIVIVFTADNLMDKISKRQRFLAISFGGFLLVSAALLDYINWISQ